jgi:hypothetical protein
VVDATMTRILEPDDDEIGWLAQQRRVPLGYLGDAARPRARSRSSRASGIPSRRPGAPAARWRRRAANRDAVTINSGGEKIFAEEVEGRRRTPGVSDVIVVGDRPSAGARRSSRSWWPPRVRCFDDESLLAEAETPRPLQAAEGVHRPRPHRALARRAGRLSLGTRPGGGRTGVTLSRGIAASLSG